MDNLRQDVRQLYGNRTGLDGLESLFEPAQRVEVEPVPLPPGYEDMLASLGSAYAQLQEAHHKIGYLESAVHCYREQAEMLSELEACSCAAAQAPRARAGPQLPAIRHVRRADGFAELIIASPFPEERREQRHSGWWLNLWSVIVGDDNDDRHGTRQLDMKDYYAMIRRALEE